MALCVNACAALCLPLSAGFSQFDTLAIPDTCHHLVCS